MTSEDGLTFGIVDYILFIAMLAISTGIGIAMSLRGNNTPEDYLLGNRSFHPVPIAMSLLTSMVSSISLLGFTGEAYAYGLQFSVYVAGVILALIFCYFMIIPVLFPLGLTSVNEYLKMRFKSTKLQMAVCLLSCLQGFLYAAIYLYAPTIALASVTSFSTKTYIYILGLICTLYSTIGGIKAVVWTDVLQLTVVMIGLTTIVILGCSLLGGIENVWIEAKEGGRFNLFNMNLGIYERHTFPNVILYGFFYLIANFGISQINMQRMSCVPTIKDAKLIVILNIFGYLIIYFLVFTCGIMCYATYSGCDPLKLGKITKSDQILSYFVMDKLGYIIGLPGLFIASLVGGSLSSISSVISAQVSMIWRDILLHFKYIQSSTPLRSSIITKVMSMLIGLILIGMALLASEAKNLLDMVIAVSGASLGPILGVFMLGIFFPKCNTKGAIGGLTISWLFLCWIVIGGFLYRPKPVLLPFSIENCNTNVTAELAHLGMNKKAGTNFEFPLMWLYGISSNMYAVIGPFLCIICGLIVSCITGSQNISDVSPLLIAPCVRRFYWFKEQPSSLKEVPQVPKY